MESKKLNEAGFASIVIAMTLILVLSLMTVGFATLMRKEQRSALDKHLSSQAYYAAESGVNAAANAIRSGYKYAKTDCSGGINNSAPQAARNYLADPNVGEDDSVSNTCLLIDPTPTNLEYRIEPDANTDQEKLTQITGLDGAGNTAFIRKIVVSWEQSGPSTLSTKFAAGGSNYDFRPVTSWPYSTGVIRAMLMPLNSSCLSRDCLLAHNYTTFLYPRATDGENTWNLNTTFPTGGSSYNFASTSTQAAADALQDVNGPILSGRCSESRSGDNLMCTATIDGLPASQDYILGLRGLYQESKVKVFVYDGSGNRLRIANAQAVVDSTGRAQDVLRRIQVRVPLTNSYNLPANALEVVDGICKQLQLTPSSSTNACSP